MSATDDRDDNGFGPPGGPDPARDNHHGYEDPTGGAAAAAGNWAAQLRALHTACLAGATLAWGDAFALLYAPTARRLSGRPRFRRVDPQVVADAVTDAVVDYVTRPQRFDPAVGVPLDRYLERAADRNVLNLLRSETRRRRREQKAAEASPHVAATPPAVPPTNPVELGSAAGNAFPDEPTDPTARDRRRLLALLADQADRQVLELQLAGERRTAVFAEAMGVAHLPAAEQRKLVKRAKDRIDKTLRRAVRQDDQDREVYR